METTDTTSIDPIVQQEAPELPLTMADKLKALRASIDVKGPNWVCPWVNSAEAIELVRAAPDMRWMALSPDDYSVQFRTGARFVRQSWMEQSFSDYLVENELEFHLAVAAVEPNLVAAMNHRMKGHADVVAIYSQASALYQKNIKARLPNDVIVFDEEEPTAWLIWSR